MKEDIASYSSAIISVQVEVLKGSSVTLICLRCIKVYRETDSTLLLLNWLAFKIN